MAAQSESNRRHKLLIMQSFQYNYIMVGLVTVLLAVNVVIIGTLLALGGTNKIGFSPLHGAAIGVAELVLVGVVAWLGLKKSHTIAGPVMVLERNMGWIRDGDLSFKMRLRKSDRFQESVTVFNGMIGELRQRITGMKADVATLRQKAANSPEVDAIARDLEEKLSYFKTEATSSEEAADDKTED